MKRFIFGFFLLLLMCTSCTTVRKMSFAGGADMILPVTDYPEFTISKGDEIFVYVSALDERAVAPFNTGHAYYVEKNGYIQLPLMDSIFVVGKTLAETKQIILNLLKNKVVAPYVSISFASASISVLGEVNSPQQLVVTRPITIFEAIGAANGLTRNACYTEVEVLRAADHEVKKSIIDLTSSTVVQSPCYYLQKGDVVNVRPLHPVLAK